MQTFHATLTHIDAAHQRRFAHIDRNIVDVVERLDMLERRTTKHDGQIATYEQVLATAETVEPIAHMLDDSFGRSDSEHNLQAFGLQTPARNLDTALPSHKVLAAGVSF